MGRQKLEEAYTLQTAVRRDRRVKNVEVVEVDGVEYINIVLEDKPVARNVLALVGIERPGETPLPKSDHFGVAEKDPRRFD